MGPLYRGSTFTNYSPGCTTFNYDATGGACMQEMSDDCTRTSYLVQGGVECDGAEQDLGNFGTFQECEAACEEESGCVDFIYGTGAKAGRCYWEKSGCGQPHGERLQSLQAFLTTLAQRVTQQIYIPLTSCRVLSVQMASTKNIQVTRLQKLPCGFYGSFQPY